MRACLGLVLTDFHLVCFCRCCVWVCWPRVRFLDLFALPFLVLPSLFACRVSVSEQFAVQLQEWRLNSYCPAAPSPPPPTHPLPHLSLTLLWLWSVFVGATHPPGRSSVRPKPENCVCHEELRHRRRPVCYRGDSAHHQPGGSTGCMSQEWAAEIEGWLLLCDDNHGKVHSTSLTKILLLAMAASSTLLDYFPPLGHTPH